MDIVSIWYIQFSKVKPTGSPAQFFLSILLGVKYFTCESCDMLTSYLDSIVFSAIYKNSPVDVSSVKSTLYMQKPTMYKQ